MDNDNRGALWRNDNKTAGDKKPHFLGKAEIGGIEYRVSCWATEPSLLDENPRRPRLSLQFRTEEEYQAIIGKQHSAGVQQATQVLTGSKPSSDYDFEDDIPF